MIFFFFTLPLHSLSLVPCMPDIPSVISHPFQSASFGVKGDPREWQGHLQTWHENKGYSAQQTVSVSKPLGQMATVCQGDGQSPRFTSANPHLYEHTLYKYTIIT